MDSIQRQSQNVPSSLFLCCLFIVHFSIEIFRARFVWFLSTGWFFHQRSGCQTDQSFVLKQHLCFSTEKKKEKRQRKEAKKRREFLSAEEGLFWAVVMTTIEARVIFSFRKRKKKKRRQDKTTTSSLTSFLTALFIAVVGAVVLAVASPWQPDAASGPAAELVGRAHGRGWRRRWHERGKKTHTFRYTWHVSVIRMKAAATHCSSFRPTDRRSRIRRRTSSRRWCTSRCCTWIQLICRAGGRLHTQTHTHRMTSTQWQQSWLNQLYTGKMIIRASRSCS